MKFLTELLRGILQIPFLILMGVTLLFVMTLFVFFDWLFSDNDELEANGYRNSF